MNASTRFFKFISFSCLILFAHAAFSICLLQNAIITKNVGIHGPIILKISDRISKSQLEDFKYSLVSKKTTTILSTEEVIANTSSTYVVLKRELSKTLPEGTYKIEVINKDKGTLNISDNFVIVNNNKKESQPLEIISFSSNDQMVRIKTNLKGQLIKINIKMNSLLESHTFALSSNNTGYITIGTKGCFSNYRLEKGQTYKITLQTIQLDGKYSKATQEISVTIK